MSLGHLIFPPQEGGEGLYRSPSSTFRQKTCLLSIVFSRLEFRSGKRHFYKENLNLQRAPHAKCT